MNASISEKQAQHPYREQVERVLDSINYCSIIEDVDPVSSLIPCDHCGEEAYFTLLNSCLNCDDA